MSREILGALCRAAEAIAIMFGTNCETVVHDFTNAQCRIAAIYNGHVSGRDIGSTDTIYGKSISACNCKEMIPDEDYVNTVVISSDGRQIKTSSINFVGDGYHYVLGINFDSTAISAMETFIKDLLRADNSFSASSLADKKLSEATDYCLSVIGKPSERMSKADRMRVVSMLEKSNIFSFQRAVPYVSERLGVSRYTIYNYLHEIRNTQRPARRQTPPAQ